MTFEEFFQKKRIDLTKLQSGEPALFFEFKTHFEQMGEKSFDHTKKYWFNKLRLSYHLAPEQKPEKMHLENRLAEQTIVETLTVELKAESPKLKAKSTQEAAEPAEKSAGFKPRFNPKMVPPKVEAIEENKPIEASEAAPSPPSADTSALPAEAAPKPAGFKPRFNAKMVAPKAEVTEEEANTESPIVETATPAESSAPKPAGFKPRFNAKMMAPKPEVAEEKPEETIQRGSPITEVPASEAVPPDAKPAGFKPRFNMNMVAPKPVEEDKPKAEVAAPIAEKPVEPAVETPEVPESSVDEALPRQVGFKPRFNMKMVAAKTVDEEEQPEVERLEFDHEQLVVKSPDEAAAPEMPAEESIPKPVGFKPRFNAAKMKPKPPEE